MHRTQTNELHTAHAETQWMLRIRFPAGSWGHIGISGSIEKPTQTPHSRRNHVAMFPRLGGMIRVPAAPGRSTSGAAAGRR
jgi:hypothetical protein